MLTKGNTVIWSDFQYNLDDNESLHDPKRSYCPFKLVLVNVYIYIKSFGFRWNFCDARSYTEMFY